METGNIMNYDDFVATLLLSGFSLGGGNDEGIYSIITWGYDEEAPYQTPVKWHTGDKETDPWEWRMRVLDERNDIAYAKIFFKKSGFVTKEWAPYFLSTRRNNKTFDDEYAFGKMTAESKRIYSAINTHGVLPLHAIKQLGGFTKEDKGLFDKALIELQMKMFITMCGKENKVTKKGEAYGWSSTVFATTEAFWGKEVFDKASKMNKDEAFDAIMKRVRQLNQNADIKKIKKFIEG